MHTAKLSTKRTGNYKAGPGRPPGRKNNRTLEIEAAAQEAIAAIEGTFEGDAHAFLASVYKNPNMSLEVRILAAGRALRVEKPVLSAVHGRMDVTFDIAERMQAARKRVAAQPERNNAVALIDGVRGSPSFAENAALRMVENGDAD